MATYTYDPNEAVYPAASSFETPDLTDVTSGVNENKSADSYIDTSTGTVAGQLSGLLSSGSQYLQQAQSNAMKTANQRGLLNSSMAATAGTSAAIENALPIAQQDAETYTQFGLNNQESDMNKQSAQLEQNQAVSNAQLTGSLNEQTYENTLKEAGVNFSFDEQLTQMGLDSAEKQAFADMMSGQTETIMSAMASLLNNTDIEVGPTTSSWMSDFMYSGWETVASLLGLNISVK